MSTIDIKEVYRYLGFGRKHIIPNDDLNAQIMRCIDDIKKVATPKSTYGCFPLTIDQETLSFGPITTSSQNLRKNLNGCQEVYVLAATLGIEVDRYIRRAEIMNMADAAIYQAIGAAYIESVVDDLNEQIRNEAKHKGMSTRPRYSPGYGDFGLAYQRQVLPLIHADTIGITLTSGDLMIPSKSVTAIIGCTTDQKDAKPSDCSTCDLQETCEMRKTI